MVLFLCSSPSCCSTPPAPASSPSSGRPSPSMFWVTLWPSRAVPRTLRAASEPKWIGEILCGTPRRRGNRCRFSSSAREGSPSPCLGNRVFIKGLPSSTSEGTLVKTFSQFGEVSGVKIITSKASKQSLGLAYVWFTSEEDAELAVKEMDGKFFDGRFIYVRIARPESPTRQVKATPYKF